MSDYLTIEVYELVARESKTVTVLAHADECPKCHMGGTQRIVGAVRDPRRRIRIEVCYQCVRHDCLCLFIGYFEAVNPHHPEDGYHLRQTAPWGARARAFSNLISETSKGFVSIYNEAYAAEQHGLRQVAGPGYRKALEFLLKDWLVSQLRDAAETSTQLASKLEEDIARVQANHRLQELINQGVPNATLHDNATTAWWLGNDESHYWRKWDSKDLQDLIDTIDLVVTGLEYELKSAALRESMKNESGGGSTG